MRYNRHVNTLATSNDIKLTPAQNKVIYCLQNDWVLITDCTVKGAWVGYTNGKQFHINSSLFWKLVDMGLIYQEQRNWNYILTDLGSTIKTKPIVL